MSAPSISETIQFLKFIRRGYDPEELVERVLEETSRKIDEQVLAVATAILSQQVAVERQIGGLIPRIEALDIVELGQSQCVEFQQQLDVLRGIQQQLQNILAQKKLALNSRGQSVMELNRGFQQLNPQLDRLSSPYEDPLLEFGHKASSSFHKNTDGQ